VPENWHNRNLFLARLSASLHMSQNPGDDSEQTLWETVEDLHAIVEASPVAIIALDGVGQVRMWNPSAERIFGWTENEVVGHHNPTIPKELEPEYRSLVASRMQGLSQAGYETTRLCKDGSLIEVGVWSAPLRDSAGEITGMMTMLVDTTNNKRAENERVQLLASEKAARAEAGDPSVGRRIVTAHCARSFGAATACGP